MEVFTELKPTTFKVQQMALLSFPNAEHLYQEMARALISIDQLQDTLDQMHIEAAQNNTRTRSRAQKVHNIRTKVLSIKFSIVDYVLICNARNRQHNLSCYWIRLMPVVSAKYHLVFKLENLQKASWKTGECLEDGGIPCTAV